MILDLRLADDVTVTFGSTSETRIVLHRTDWIAMGMPGRINAELSPREVQK